jgi:beta-N-acetylhexosaminidase
VLATSVALGGTLAACSPGSSGGSADAPASSSAPSDGETSAASSATPTVDPDTPLAWGPTVGELEGARELVAGWSAKRLAGQVIVGRYHGTDPSVPARLVADHHLAGVQMTGDSIRDRGQVLATTKAVARAVRRDGRDFPPVVGVDQEGGVVSHLDGVATEFPSFATAGRAVAAAPRANRRVVRRAADATGLELRALGFTWVFAPVADVTIGAADPTIGSRSASSNPRIAALATLSAVQGYDDAGVVSTVKHFPGHGSATADSHLTLPRIDAGMARLRRHDLVPFRRAVRAGAPAVMVGHLDVPALAEPGVPASLAPAAYDYLREDLGFEGVAITDSLGMGAVVATGKPAVDALAAGADLLLMPADTARSAVTVTRAIRSGEVPRDRAEEAAARVVALQRWQQRRAEATPVPGDVTSRARAAAAALTDAAY